MPAPHTMVQFGPWRPDLPEIGAGYTTRIVNARPGTDGFRPVQEPVLDTGFALPDQAISMGVARYPNGDLHTTVAAGTRLYRWVPTGSGSLFDISKGGVDYLVKSPWEFELYGNFQLAAQSGERIQALTLDGVSDYADLSATAPYSTYITIVRDQVVAGYTGATASDLVLNQVQFSPIGAPDGDWTPNATTQAGSQILHDMGAIQGITGGEFGLIVTDRGVVRMTYVNVPWIYQFDVISRNVNCRVPLSITQYNHITYFWAPDGIYACDGNQVRDIGTQKVNFWLLQDFDPAFAHRVRTQIDTQRGLIMWGYPGKGHNAAGDPNHILIYDPGLGEFGYQELNDGFETIGLSQVGGYTMDGVTWDETTHPDVNLDSQEYRASDVVLSIVRSGSRDIRFLSGQAMQAEFDTPEMQIAPGRRSVMSELVAVYEGFGNTVSVGTRPTRAGQQTWTPFYSPLADGTIRPRAYGRYHVARVRLDPGWFSSVGVNVHGRQVSTR